jgi:hypothetical protein
MKRASICTYYALFIIPVYYDSVLVHPNAAWGNRTRAHLVIWALAGALAYEGGRKLLSSNPGERLVNAQMNLEKKIFGAFTTQVEICSASRAAAELDVDGCCP